MFVEFTLPVKAFSINRMSSRDQRFKTAEYKAWATEVLVRLRGLPECASLLSMAADFGTEGGAFKVQFTATYPEHVYYNAKKQISSKTVDCTNFGKPLLDLIFGDTMNVNDKFVIECTERKQVGPTFGIVVRIAHVQF